jgi:hypothetical protein
MVTFAGQRRYLGEIQGHPTRANGLPCCTTDIVKIHENGTIETRNTVYTLGKFDQKLQDKMNLLGLGAEGD